MNRQMRRRKHIFPRRTLRYLPANHPLHAGKAAESHSIETLFPTLESQSATAATLAAAAAENPEERSSTGDVVQQQQQQQQQRQKRYRRQPGGFLHDEDNNALYSEDMSYLSKPEKGKGRVWVAKRRHVPLGRKRLLLLLRLIKGLHLTDALDWLQALALHRANALLNLLTKEQLRMRDQGADISRVFIDSYIIGPAGHVKTLRVGHNYRVSFLKSYRYYVAIRLRELPLHEYFHRLFILKQVPRSMGHDMRLALRQQQLPQEAARDWLPYLDAHTRAQHKRVR
ncbi:hypothetical protein, conserved [Eimeria acervulina]|uniref:Uncharacterized protein n=1 Tax=Eimeria acervulina TaxID=5801 RepID=U6GD58_EIMAC|nr:hypothetical protein, conserved [Eimeria acervulina]CDI78201.1 hypothetical protein, conserved [Eimeria acervulina]